MQSGLKVYCPFAFIHHYNEFELKQSSCDWSADFKLLLKELNKQI